VVWMSGLTVWREGQNRVRSYLANDLCNLIRGCIDVHTSAATIRIVQPAMLGDAQDPETLGQLGLTYGYQLLGRPPRWVGNAQLATSGRHADDAGLRRGSHRHDTAT